MHKFMSVRLDLDPQCFYSGYCDNNLPYPPPLPRYNSLPQPLSLPQLNHHLSRLS